MAKKAAKKKKIKKKVKIRLFLFFILFGILISILSYKLFLYISQIRNILDETDSLKNELVNLQDEEKKLESDIQKLQDPSYIAKYAREKYLYSKEGELIIRIPDESKDN